MAQDIGDYEEAVRDLSEAIKLNPGDAFNYQSRAVNYHLLYRYSEALADFRRAIELSPDNAGNYYLRGQVYYDVQDYQRAAQDYSAAIRHAPSHKNYYEVRGFAHLHLGDYDAMMDDFNRCVELEPKNSLTYYWRSVARLRIGQYQESIDDMNKSQALDENDGLTLAYSAFWRGVAYRLMGDEEQAVREFDLSLDKTNLIEDEDQRNRILAVWYLVVRGDEEATRRLYGKVLENNPQPNKVFSPRFYLYQLAYLFPQRQDIRRIHEWFEGEMPARPTDLPLH